MLKGTVLIVDDTVASLNIVVQVLTEAGYEVAVAMDGDRALNLIYNHPPDLILLDVHMSGMNGFEVCKQLTNDPTTAHIPVIFMTALNDPMSKVKGFDAGAVDYITKPFHEQELLARVKAHLQLRQLNHELEALVEQRTKDLQNALHQLKDSHIRLVESEKMSALGNLIAGIAHEMNNPLGFVDGSINNATTYVSDLIEHLELYQQAFPDGTEDIIDNADYINLNFLIR